MPNTRRGRSERQLPAFLALTYTLGSGGSYFGVRPQAREVWVDVRRHGAQAPSRRTPFSKRATEVQPFTPDVETPDDVETPFLFGNLSPKRGDALRRGDAGMAQLEGHCSCGSCQAACKQASEHDFQLEVG